MKELESEKTNIFSALMQIQEKVNDAGKEMFKKKHKTREYLEGMKEVQELKVDLSIISKYLYFESKNYETLK